MLSQKVFGIGLPKTGTSSLHAAAEILGLRSVHYAHDATTVRQLREGDYRLEVMGEVDLISDVPVPAVFPQLDSAFPGSKFILTYRELEPWIASQDKAEFNHNLPEPGSHREFYRTLLYGVVHYSEERFRWVHRDHHDKVRRYFEGREADLLTIDVTVPGQWEPLCDFLGLPVPDVEFPHKNPMRTETPAARPGLRDRLRRRTR